MPHFLTIRESRLRKDTWGVWTTSGRWIYNVFLFFFQNYSILSQRFRSSAYTSPDFEIHDSSYVDRSITLDYSVHTNSDDKVTFTMTQIAGGTKWVSLQWSLELIINSFLIEISLVD